MKQTKKIMGLAMAAVMACTAFAGIGNTNTAKAAAEFDPAGTYHARMGVQTCNTLWVCNMNYYNADQNSAFGTEKENKLYCADASGEGKILDGEISEIELAGNGTYTVSLTGADFSGETSISQLHVATDIPLNDQIKFSDVKVVIDGKEFATFDEGVMEDEEPYLTAGMVLLCANHWRDSLSQLLESKGQYKEGSGYPVLTGEGNEDIQITFTISGFNYDNPDAVEATEAPEEKDTGKTSEVSKDKTDSSNNQVVPIVIGVVAVVVVVGVIIVVVKRKKK